MARKELRQSSADFLKIMVEKIGQKEEPASPNFNFQDVQKIEELTNKLRENFSSRLLKK